MGDCSIAVALPGRRALRLRLPPGAELQQVFDGVARETSQSPEDCAKHYQLQARASEPPYEPRLLTAPVDGARTLSECGLVPQAALVLKAIAGSAVSTQRDGASDSSELVGGALADAVEAAAEADRKAMELEKVELFCAFTGADRRTAKAILSRVGWVLENATNHFFEAGLEGGEGAEGDEEVREVNDVDVVEAGPGQDHDRHEVIVEHSQSSAQAGQHGDLQRGSSGSVPETVPEPEPEQEQETRRKMLAEGVTPPSGREAWRTHDDQAKHLLHDWLAAGGLKSFADSWADVGLDSLQDFREFWHACPGPGSEQWMLLPDPRPRPFEFSRARRLLAMIDDAAEAQGTAAPFPPAPLAPSDGAGADGAGAEEMVSVARCTSLSEWLSDAKLSEYEAMLVDAGGLALADIPHVTQEELQTIGMEKEFHRKRFLRMARR